MNAMSLALVLQDAASTTPGAQQAPASMLQSIFGSPLLPVVGCFAVFWFIIIRPEQKQRKLRAQMLAAMKKGDKVLTTGGLYGQIVQIQDDVVTLQVAEGTRLRFTRGAIQSVEAEPSESGVEAKTNSA